MPSSSPKTSGLGLAGWIVLGAVLAAGQIAAAAVIRVPADQPTIQTGIDVALAGDTVLVAAGTYTGAGNRDLDFGGRAITVVSESGAAATIIDCELAGRGVYFHSGEGPDSILQGLTIQNGAALAPLDMGGGILCEGASPTIRACVIRYCQADTTYAAMYCLDSSPAIVACTITANTVGPFGGVGIQGGAPVVEDCLISSNLGGLSCYLTTLTLRNCELRANDDAGMVCGAMDAAFSDLSISGCRFADNGTRNPLPILGAGIRFYEGCTGLVVDCTFTGNRVYDAGAALSFEYCGPTVANCVFDGNFAVQSSGAIHVCFGASPTIVNCLFTNNEAGNFGGAVHSHSELESTFVNCTFAGNIAQGTVGAVAAGPGVVNLRNCILWGDSPDEIGGSVTATYCDIQGGYAGTGNIDLDPLFVAGPGGDCCLSQTAAGQPADSPCLDAGAEAAAAVCYAGAAGGTVCLDSLSTRTDYAGDSGQVDMGYHHDEVPPLPATGPLGLALLVLTLGWALGRGRRK